MSTDDIRGPLSGFESDRSDMYRLTSARAHECIRKIAGENA